LNFQRFVFVNLFNFGLGVVLKCRIVVYLTLYPVPEVQSANHECEGEHLWEIHPRDAVSWSEMYHETRGNLNRNSLFDYHGITPGRGIYVL